MCLHSNSSSSLQNLCGSLYGKSLMFYNLFIIFRNILALALLLMHYWIVVNSQAICHIVTITLTLTLSGVELFTTNILYYVYHSAYLMYRCYHLRSAISKKKSEYLFRCYTAYAVYTLLLLFLSQLFMIGGLEWVNTQS